MVPAEHTLQRGLSSIVLITRLLGCIPRNGGNPFSGYGGPGGGVRPAHPTPTGHSGIAVTLIIQPATRPR